MDSTAMTNSTLRGYFFEVLQGARDQHHRATCGCDFGRYRTVQPTTFR